MAGAVATARRRPGLALPTVTVYRLVGPDGEPLAEHVRRDGPDGKRLWWRLPDGTLGLGGHALADLPLYRAEWLALRPDEPVYVTEGEKAADALAHAAGLLAVGTVTGAASMPGPAALETLRGREVRLWPDRDAVGEGHMERIGLALRDVAASVATVDWPDAPEHGDAADFLVDGRTAADVLALPSRPADLSALPALSALPRRPVLDPAALHGLPGRVVAVVDPRTEADPAAVLVSFLAAFGSAVGSRPHANVGADRHRANLFVAIVGPTSSGRKGASWSPVRELMRRACPEWPERIVSGLGSGEGLIAAVRDPAGDNPGEPDKRALVFASELAGVLSVMARQGATLSATLRDAWENGDLRQTVKNSPLRATGAHVAIVAHVTPDELRKNLSAVESTNGFAGRFLWVAAHRSKLLAHPPEFDGPAIDTLVAEIAATVAWASERDVLVDDRAAWDLWESVYPTLTRERPGLAGAILSRAPAHVRRLALVYALADRSTLIRPAHLQAALALWAYAEQSVRDIFGTLTGDSVADRIDAALTDRDYTRDGLRDLFDRHVSAARLDAALSLLADDGRVAVRRETTTGRPRDVWGLVRGSAISAESAERSHGLPLTAHTALSAQARTVPVGLDYPPSATDTDDAAATDLDGLPWDYPDDAETRVP